MGKNRDINRNKGTIARAELENVREDLNEVAVDLHLGTAIAALLDSPGEHKIAHPVSANFARFDREMVALAVLVVVVGK